MDYVASDQEFPSEQSTDELFDKFFSIPCGQQDSSNQKKENELNFDPLRDEDHDGNVNVVESKKGDCSQGQGMRKGGRRAFENENKRSKVLHRNIERQRRQEMTTLYATLRSLLPLEYLKGKRSISDHMYEAVKYIKHLQNRITKLSDKRDDLRRSSDLHTTISIPESSSKECSEPEDSVAVTACFVGVEVSINTGLRRNLILSKVLDVIVAEGLNVVNCISTKGNERVLCTIESEVNDQRSIELSELQKKITKLIVNSPSQFDFKSC